MRKKPSSAKKHKHLRRPRNVDWNESRRKMLERERLVEIEADKFLQEQYANRPDKT